jgi:copper(I)-binding protein
MLMGLVEKLEKGKSFTLTFKLENNKLINAEIMILDNKLRKNLLEEE